MTYIIGIAAVLCIGVFCWKWYSADKKEPEDVGRLNMEYEYWSGVLKKDDYIKLENEGISIYTYYENSQKWVCSNCETENENEMRNCCVCYQER